MWKLALPSSITSLGSFSCGNIVCVIVPSTSPVSIGSNAFSQNTGIFVPSSLIEMYKVMTNWVDYSTKIFSIDNYKEKNEFTFVDSGYVDMGTSIKWAAYNIGATKPEDCGDYYAWGATSPSTFYSWSTYSLCNGSSSSLTKYNTSSSNGTIDNKTVLDADDDVAHIRWDGNWRIPTDEEWTELVSSCIWNWTTYEGTNGRMVYSFETGNAVFLPAAGYRVNEYFSFTGSYGSYWSSSLHTGSPTVAWELFFDSYDVRSSTNYRYCGLSIRPVCD